MNRSASTVVFRGIPAIAFKNDRNLIAAPAEHVPIDEVETSIGLSVYEPAVVGGQAVVEGVRPRLPAGIGMRAAGVTIVPTRPLACVGLADPRLGVAVKPV